MAVLGSLPVELVSQCDGQSPENILSLLCFTQIARIGELTDIDSQLDLALASHYIANALQDLFKRHRFAHKWATCSDVLPLTVPHTLRAVIADPLVASHVRTIQYISIMIIRFMEATCSRRTKQYLVRKVAVGRVEACQTVRSFQ